MLAALLLLLPLAQPVVEIPKGAPVQMDGTLGQEEWATAYALRRTVGQDRHVELKMQRQGPYLAIGVEADREYRGEVLRLCVADDAGSWICSIFLTLGRPEMPPLLWRRGPPG